MRVRRLFTSSFRSVIIPALGLVGLQGAYCQGPLNYFKNYFVTGDYAVSGVGLAGSTGSATGTINLTSVPCTSGPGLLANVIPCSTKGSQPADVIAAFLYWQSIETTAAPAYARGSFDGTTANPNPFLSVALGNTSVPACGPGGTTQSKAYARVYRADVLRYLPINQAASVRVANGAHTIKLTSGDPGTQFAGATLVVVYRLVTPGNPRVARLRSVVLYDGTFTGTSSLGLNQTLGGFYQASGDADATMTQIVGNGQSAVRGERQTLTINGSTPQGVPSDPFTGAQGANWDNFTFGFNLAPNASSLGTQVQLSQSCLTWAAIVTSTNVQDTDADGLLDIWETSGLNLIPGVRNDGQASAAPVPPTFGTCVSNAATCLNLPKMGANPLIPDIFMQIDWMQSTGLPNPDHTHNPQLAALNMVGAAFKTRGINMHFDVGASNTYQGQSSPYIVPAAYAQGGNVVQESAVLCQPSQTTGCAFSPESGQYSVLGWKTGFDAIRDGDSYFPCPIYPVNKSCTPTPLPQLFATNRKDTFHYALFAHAISATSPLSAPLPASISGVADRPGADLMVTLGLWRSDLPAVDQVGSVVQQAGTLMHELGHNLDLSHGGLNTTPNCMPNYPSVMNYLYQTRGLTDAAGNENVDYSWAVQLPLAEGFLSSSFPMGLQKYRVRYFGPLNPVTNGQGQAAQVHCDGTLLNTGVSEGQYTRLESSGISTPDWSNGTIKPAGKLITSGLDINYNGVLGETFFDQPDWISLNLQQVGARPNADGMSLNIGVSDIGVSDIGVSDIGVSDIGVSDIGVSDIGVSDIGVSDIGVSDIGTANLGQDALGDEDYISHLLGGVDPPPSPSTSCPTCGLTATSQIGGNLLNWTATDTGPVARYNIYRCNATAGPCTPAPPALAATSGSPAPTTYTDAVNDTVDAGATCPATSTCYNTPYTYYVTAVVNVNAVVNGVSTVIPSESGPSNTAGGQVNHLFVIANNQAIVYGAANPAPTFNIYGNVAGSLANTAVTCAYPASPANSSGYLDASTTGYPITCSGPLTASATDGISYNASYLTYTPGTLTVSQRPITVTATASSKVYDSTTASASVPAITGTLATGDTAGFIETYDNKNVGPTHVMTASGIVNDTNGGNNYAVTFVPINGGVITQAPLTITAATNSKYYDRTTSALASPVVSGLKGSTDSVTGLVETYNTINAGTNLLLTVSQGYAVNDGNGGNNYLVTTATNSTGVIIQAPVTAAITPAGKPYDTTPVVTVASCSLTGVITADANNVGCAVTGAVFASSNAGTWGVTGTVGLTGGAAGNYAISSTVFGTATISQYSVTATITAADKSFDGTTAATITNCSVATVYPSDSNNVNCSASGATFASTGPGAGLQVTANVSLGGSAAGNYVLTSSTVITTATISDGINLQGLTKGGAPMPPPPVWTTALQGGGMALQLANSTSQTTSAWLPTAVPINSPFTTSFQFQISAERGVNSIGDGFAFVIQGAGATALGATGQGAFIGYDGIPNSIAIEFDTYYNSDFGDPAATDTVPSGSHVGIQSNGALANDSHHNKAANLAGPALYNFADGTTHTAKITYDGTATVSVFLDGSQTPIVTKTLTAPLNTFLGINGTSAYVGFTAATGDAQEDTDLLTWSWN